ncbi:hypothetical protein FJQ98_16095 [Lysinibacillus agricola]|uniref:YopX protein domain-containing protein n=1 Tax=Lysinibacillus agricola TaxID=2590012 RepID=A0ABX7ALJ3_9BACI|nr:YopX family protein [Lysinibacillus agricola]QQP10767.1 hypothetical protein FJQ98_16095 [Lysinibacillus agricola]
MREKNFRYTFMHVQTGNIEQKIYTLNQLEERNTKDLSPCFNAEFGYKLIGRDEFTGLKDKNSKDIYEGDVTKGHLWRKGKGYRHVGRVAYVHSAFKVRGVKQYFGMDDELNMTYEIIGNIYENPEML